MTLIDLSLKLTSSRRQFRSFALHVTRPEKHMYTHNASKKSARLSPAVEFELRSVHVSA